MPVIGASKVVKRLQEMSQRVRETMSVAVEEGAEKVLADMKAFTPVDPATPVHARDGLTIQYDNDGLTAHVGLPTKELTEDYFWFRFLDGGTKGYNPGDTRRTAGSKTTKKIYRHVPARPALRIRERALDGNRDEIERMVREAIAKAMRKG